MARIRGWRWLAIGGIVGSLVWGLLLGHIVAPNTAAAELLLVAGLPRSTSARFSVGPHADEPPRPHARCRSRLSRSPASSALSLYYVRSAIRSIPLLVSGILLSGALGAVASRWTRRRRRGAHRRRARRRDRDADPPCPDADRPRHRCEIGALEWNVLGDAGTRPLRAAGRGDRARRRRRRLLRAPTARRRAPRAPPAIFAAAGAGAPLVILVVIYLRHVPFETRPAIGIAALILAAIFAAMTERLIARRPHDDMAPAPALYAAGAVLALSFAAAVGLADPLHPARAFARRGGRRLGQPLPSGEGACLARGRGRRPRLRGDRLRPAAHAGGDRHAADPERPHPPLRPAGAGDPLRRRDAAPAPRRHRGRASCRRSG